MSLDANGNTTAQGSRTFHYSADNRLREVDDNGTPSATYTYNGLGQRVGKQVGTQSSGYVYDLAGHLVAELDASGTPTKEYVYLDGQPLAVLVPGAAAAPTNVYHYAGTVTTSLSTAAGASGNVTAPVELTLDTAQRTLTYTRPDGALAGTNVPAQHTFVIPADKWRLVAGTPDEVVFSVLQYDDVHASIKSCEATLDPGTGTISCSMTWNPSYEAQHSYRGAATQTTYGAADLVDGAAADLSFDTANHQITVNEPNGVTGTYSIDADHWRTYSGTDSNGVAWSSLTASYSDGNTSISAYRITSGSDYSTAGLTTQIGARAEEYMRLNAQPQPGSTQTAVYYVHTDQLGTPQRLTDANATVVWTAQYDPFGAATVNTDPDGDGHTVTLNLRFPGQYFDSETGLHYNYYRYYDPNTGRYVSSDPIGLNGGLNTYVYVMDNPIRWGDPLGAVRWHGSKFEVSGVLLVGGSYTRFKLTSDCVNGRRAKVTVLAVGPSIGVGLSAKHSPPIAPSGTPDVTFEDYRKSLDPSVFNGFYSAYSAGGTALVVSGGLAFNFLGQAKNVHPLGIELSVGLGAGMTYTFGSSTVWSSEIESCGCGNK